MQFRLCLRIFDFPISEWLSEYGWLILGYPPFFDPFAVNVKLNKRTAFF